MQIGIRLHDTAEQPFEERLETVRNQGFSCVQLALSKTFRNLPVSSDALTPGFAMYLKKLFAKAGLDVAVLGCYLNLAHPDAEELRKITKEYMAHIRFASLLGCGVVGTETGAPNREYKFEDACHSRAALDTFIRNLRPVVRYAEKMGVILAIEPVFKHIVHDSQSTKTVLDEIDSPNLQVIFDPVNLLDISNYNNQGDIIEEAVTVLGSDIAVVHLKDFVIEDNHMIPVAAGLGNMNYNAVIKFIKEKKPYIQVCLENTLPENAVKTKEFVEKMWGRS